ncbi:hypothetical protein, variant [Saprolegnia diclina VS20]|uniref:UBA domain-containing protein n=1 Tax=Saprolegnia diclina (strain VS20) TaxID=1156394 RepID=T0QMP9_SAPDV|nr:hypothetical protein, variant [Saprolegnia diclina VS20]EQC35956.1 hypothetical protein, variant [Saprolegnia diclina VS20]|eukprot:XP_008610718.1 hypothetical protein, variant [Saprolegnia diclina VS20]
MPITTLKLLHKEAQDMRRVKVADLRDMVGRASSTELFTFGELQKYALDIAFPALQHAEVFFYYLDDEGEQVRITNDAELKEGIRLMETEGDIFKMVVSGKRQVVDQDATVSFDSECSLALFVDLSRLLDKWECSNDQAPMKKDMTTLLHVPGVQGAMIDMMADAKYTSYFENVSTVIKEGGSVVEGVASMFAGGQLQDMATALMEKCPDIKDLLESIMHAIQVQVHAHQQAKHASSVSQTLPPLPEDPSLVHQLLEFVTGKFFTDLWSLSSDQAGEVMFNCGVSSEQIQALSRESRIRWIAETIIHIQAMNQARKEQKELAEKAAQEAALSSTNHGIMDADDVDSKPSVAFMGDVSFPDGSTVRAGDSFVKTWRLKNDGKTRWPAKTELVCVGGDHLETESSLISIPILPPGKMIDVSVDMQAPSKPARYTGYWRLSTTDGKRFGQRFWVDILVVGNKTTTHELKPPASNEVVLPAAAPQVVGAAAPQNFFPTAVPKTFYAGAAPQVAVAAPEVVSQAPPAPVVVSAPVVVQAAPYASELEALESMGFSDRATNSRLLAQYNGDVSMALNHLLN